MLKTTKLPDKPAFSRNDGSRSTFNKNNNSRRISRKNNGNNEVDRFGDEKHAKKSGKLKGQKSAKF